MKASKRSRRLQLNKETLRALTATDLARVAGGDIIIRKLPEDTMWCSGECPPTQMVDGCAVAC